MNDKEDRDPYPSWSKDFAEEVQHGVEELAGKGKDPAGIGVDVDPPGTLEGEALESRGTRAGNIANAQYRLLRQNAELEKNVQHQITPRTTYVDPNIPGDKGFTVTQPYGANSELEKAVEAANAAKADAMQLRYQQEVAKEQKAAAAVE